MAIKKEVFLKICSRLKKIDKVILDQTLKSKPLTEDTNSKNFLQ